MVRYLRGIILDKVRNQIIVDVNGVGYDVFVTPTTLTKAVTGEETEFHISESVREDAHDLFGFRESSERDLFEQLRKVSGIGPKAALAILGFYTASELQSILISGDDAKLSLVPGIGRKTAGKIILELKGKVVNTEQAALPTSDPDTIDALQSLGYSPAEIAVIIPKVPVSLINSNERITWILRHLGE